MVEEIRGLPPAQTVRVEHQNSVGEARRAARTVAISLGFEPQPAEEIAIAATELATNLVKHARGGSLTILPLAANRRTGLEIQSQDNGPGIADVEQAIGDRFSTAGSRGTGLGAVNRLMDELEIASQRGRGTTIVCRKWRRTYSPSLKPCPLSFGVATRPRSPGQANGDSFVRVYWSESVLVGIIDGLGHGEAAHVAAQAARQYVEAHFDQPLDLIFRGTGRACRSTRGVVMALARFDWGEGRLVFASVGNITARIFPRSAPLHFTVRRGVIGLNAPRTAVSEHPWPVDNIFILHSDGIASRWDWKDFKSLENLPAATIARELLHARAKAEDDATVVVVRNVAS